MTNILKAKRDKISKTFSLFLVITPILDQYKLPGLSFFELFIIIAFALFVLEGNNTIKIINNWMIYFMYTCVVTIVLYIVLSQTGIIGLLLRLIKLFLLLFCLFVISPKMFRYEYGIKIYERIVVFASIILIFQNIVYILFSYPTMLLIPDVTLNYNDGVNSTAFMINTLGRIYTGYYYRACSFFIEPSYQVQYSLPLLVIQLSRYDYKDGVRKLVLPIIISVALVLTTSFLGIVSVSVLWIIVLFKMIKSFNKGVPKRIFGFILTFIAIVGYLASKPEVSMTIIGKLASITNLSSSSSFTLRVLRGWECFKNMEIGTQIFGCGYGNITSYFNYINLKTIYDGSITDISYMNGLFTLLCGAGIVGTLLYILLIIPLLKLKSRTLNFLFLCWCLLMISSASFDTAIYCLMLSIMVSVRYKHELKGDFL